MNSRPNRAPNYMRRYWKKWIDLGLCPRHPHNKLEENKKYCRSCTLYQRRYRKRLKSLGLCTAHPFRKAEKGKLQCRARLNKALLSKHNITLTQYEKMKLKQPNCPICGTCFQVEVPRIDHDHKSGKIRNLLCDRCNRGLGYFKESITAFKNAIRYLRKYNRLS